MTGPDVVLMVFLQSVPADAPSATTRQVPRPKVVCGPVTAKRTKFVSPLYPDAAVKAGKAGEVVIEMVITETGKTADLKVKRSVDPNLDQAALDAVEQWEYMPVFVGGKPRHVVRSVTVKFTLPGVEVPATNAGGGQRPH